MKYRFTLKACIYFLFLFSPTISAADVLDCPPEKEKLCSKINQLENVYFQLSEQQDSDKKKLSGPAYTLSLGYANIGNIDKAEEYLDQSYKTYPSRKNFRYNRSAIFAQYMLRGQNDEVISYLNTEGTSLPICKAAVQIYTAQKRVDLIIKLLNDTTCTPKSLSKGAEHLNRDDIIDIYEKLNLLHKDFNVANRFSSFISIMAGNALRRNILKQEIDKLTISIVQKSHENDQPHPIFDLIEKKVLEDLNSSQTLIKELISYYAARNDMKALTLFQENKNKLQREKDILPVYNLKKHPTELSFLIYKDIEDLDYRFELLKSLLHSVSNSSELAQQKEFKHISDICSTMTFPQCISAHIPKEKITEKVRLEIDALLSNYEQLHAYEKDHKTSVENFETPKILEISKTPIGSYSAKDRYMLDPLWDIHALIAHKDDCSNYYREDLENLQNNIQDLSKYTGNTPYFAVLCHFTLGQYEALVYSSGKKEYAWLTDFLSSAFSNRSVKSPETVLGDAVFLTKDIDQKIKKSIIHKLLNVVDDENVDEAQREETYNAIDTYLMAKTNYDPVLLNIVFTEYFLDHQNRRAFNLVYDIPDFQKYIEDNFKTDKISSVISTGYKIPLGKNKLINEANTLSWEVINTVKSNSEYRPHY